MRRALALLVLLAACDPPDPLLPYKVVQRRACLCTDVTCATAAEAELAAAIGAKPILPDGAAAVIAASHRCIHAAWAATHPLPALAETPPPSGTPCDQVVPKVVAALGCTTMPLDALDFLHLLLGRIQTALAARPPTPELELYDLCVGASSAVLTTTLRARCP